MKFDYQEMELEPKKKPRLVRRKITFIPSSSSEASKIFVAASKAASLYDGSIKKCRIINYMSTSYIIFKCRREDWPTIVYTFVDQCGRSIENVRFKI